MKKKSTFFSRNGLRIVLVAVFLLPPTFLCAARAFKSNKNDVQDWLPSNYKETREFAWFQQHFAGEQFVLASWDGCTLDDQRLKLFVEKLVPSDRPGHAAHGFFQSVVTGPMLLKGLKEQLNLSDAEALARLEGALIGPILPAEGKPASPADRLAASTATQAEPARQTGVVVTLSEAGKRNLRGTINTLRETAAECNIPQSSFHMGGPPVDNYAIDSAGENSLVRLAGIALIIGVVISWMCLRSVLLTVLVFVAGIYSAALSLALTRVLPTDMNAILLTMPPLVFVAGISGAIHLANYYRDLVLEQGPVGAPGKALHHAALPLGLATGTTAVGLISLCYSDLVPIQQFGIYSAVGVVASLLLLCLFLPAGFQLWPLTPAAAKSSSHAAVDEEADAEEGWGHFWWPVARFIVDRHLVVAAVGIALLAFFGWGCTRITTSVQMMRMFKSDAPILADYKWLERHLGPLVPMEVVLKIDPRVCRLSMLERIELVQKVQKQVEQLDVVGNALSVATFAPRLPEEKDYKKSSRGILGAVERIAVGRSKQKYELARTEYNKRLEEHRDNFYGQGYVALEKLPAADGTLQATGCELWRISARISALKDVDFGQFVNNIRAEVEPILAAEPDGGLGIEAKYTGLVPLIYKAQHSLLDGLLLGFIMDLVVVSIIMTLSVREWSAGIVMALPAIFPVMIVFGFMGLVGIVVDTGTVMAPGVALGVTVDDVVHFMLMYRNGLKNGLTRRDSIMLAYKGCARPMFQSWGVIGLGMSVFAMSPFTPTQRFGYLMVTLLTSALVGNLVVLPAVLASPLGALFGRRFQPGRQLSEPLPGVEPAHEHEPQPVLLRALVRDEPVAADGGRRYRG